MMKLGMCCGSGLCCTLLCGALWLGGGDAILGETAKARVEKRAAERTEGAPCGTAMTGEIADVELTADEQKVVDYFADAIERGELPSTEPAAIGKALGLPTEAIEQLDESKLRAGVMAELQRRNFDLAGLGGHCSKYSACSVDSNLMNATGEELRRYEEEVALDGTAFADRAAPDFTLPSTKGGPVSLSDHRGKNVAVVFLSAHCYHSVDTLPILAELKKKYAGETLEILPVFINSGDAKYMTSQAFEWEIDFPLLVSEGKEISAAYESRMVPTTFLIDERGNLTKKLVGFKDKAMLDRAFGELAGS